jgi:hypothetical protein
MNRNLLLFLLIFVLSASFRITNLDLIEFKTDEAVNLLLAIRPFLGYELTPGGTVSSIGILNPPLFNYILMPIAAINWDPRFIAFAIGLINSIAIAVFFLIVKKYYSLSIALISSILFALSPWAIIYSRKIWMQDLLIPFFIIIFFSVHKLIIDKKTVYWIPYALSSLILIQLHQVSLIFVGILTIFLVKKVKVNLKYALLGLILGLLPLIPYLLYQLSNGCPDCSAFLQARNRLSPGYSAETLLRPLQITSQGGFRFIMGEDTLTFAQAHPIADNLKKVFYLEYLLLPLGLFLFMKKFKHFNFFALSVLALPLIYFILKLEPFMHYYIVILPLLFLFLGVSINSLPKNFKYILLFLLILTSIAYNYSFFNLLSKKGSLNGDYGQVYHLSKKENDTRIKNLEDIRYEEAFLESFIPLNYTFGFEPLGKILYADTITEELPALENRLVTEPENQKVKHQLLAYFTPNAPTIATVDFFRKKSLDQPAYKPLYEEVYRYYLSHNFKKEYIYASGQIRFFYPEHWRVMENGQNLMVEEESYGVIISAAKQNNEGIFKVQDLKIGSLKAFYFEKNISKGEKRSDRIRTIESILSSVRPL